MVLGEWWSMAEFEVGAKQQEAESSRRHARGGPAMSTELFFLRVQGLERLQAGDGEIREPPEAPIDNRFDFRAALQVDATMTLEPIPRYST